MIRDSPGRSNNHRIALGDLTNDLGERGFSLISGSAAAKFGVWNAKNVTKENDSQQAKPISAGANFLAEISGAECPKVANADKPLPLLKGGKTYHLLSLGNADYVLDSNVKTGNQLSSAEGSLGLSGSCNTLLDVVGSGGIKESHTYSQSVSESCKDDLEIGGKNQNARQNDGSQAPQLEPVLEALGSQAASTDGKDSGFSTLLSTQCPPFVGSKLAKPQGTRPFELGRCKWLMADATSGSVSGADLLKSCSCSFCLKAAYIWSDLHYMDVKGRVSALMKSKKEATNLVRMYSVNNDISRGRGSSGSNHSELEIDLMDRCKSLFACMEDTFGRECSQLETDILSLKDIKENFKMNLGTLNEMFHDVPHSASDTSASKKIA